MAIQSPPAKNGRFRGPQSLTRGRGRPETVTQRTEAALAPITTGIALAQMVVEGADAIATCAAIGGSRQVIVNTAGRLGYNATAAIKELRAMAELVEPRR